MRADLHPSSSLEPTRQRPSKLSRWLITLICASRNGRRDAHRAVTSRRTICAALHSWGHAKVVRLLWLRCGEAGSGMALTPAPTPLSRAAGTECARERTENPAASQMAPPIRRQGRWPMRVSLAGPPRSAGPPCPRSSTRHPRRAGLPVQPALLALPALPGHPRPLDAPDPIGPGRISSSTLAATPCRKVSRGLCEKLSDRTRRLRWRYSLASSFPMLVRRSARQ